MPSSLFDRAGRVRAWKGRSLFLILSCGLLSPFLVPAQPAAAAARSRQFPPGSISRLEDLPASRLRRRLEQLPDGPRRRVLEQLRDFHFTELDLESLDVDSEGGLFYIDQFSLE